MAFAVFGPIILMLAFGYGISFDIENLATASFDQDDTPQSRELLQGFEGSRYFSMQPPIKSADEAERRLKSGNTQIVVEVPPGFGRDLLSGRKPEVDATVDGAMTFRGETAKNYVGGVVRKQGEELQREVHRPGAPNKWNDDNIQTRFRYNQAFLSVNAMVPSVFMLMLVLIPAIMSAIAVVREKETGSIANFRSTPITKFEFLIGKQMPYVAVAMINFFRAVPDGDLHLPRSDQGAVPHLADRHLRLCVRHDRVWAAHLLVRAHPGGGGVRHSDSVDRSGGQLFRPLRAGVVPLRHARRSWAYPSPRPGISRSPSACSPRRSAWPTCGAMSRRSRSSRSLSSRCRCSCSANRRLEMSSQLSAGPPPCRRKTADVARSRHQHLPPGDQGAAQHSGRPDDAHPRGLRLQHFGQHGRHRGRDRSDQPLGRHRRRGRLGSVAADRRGPATPDLPAARTDHGVANRPDDGPGQAPVRCRDPAQFRSRHPRPTQDRHPDQRGCHRGRPGRQRRELSQDRHRQRDPVDSSPARMLRRRRRSTSSCAPRSTRTSRPRGSRR